MTDSILWKGTADMLPTVLDLPFGKSGIKEEKTLGFYEKPDEVKDIICFGSGRYGFYNVTADKPVSKRRGMIINKYDNPDNIELIHDYDEEGNPKFRFEWENFRRLIRHYDTTTLKVGTRKLISTGILAHSLKYNLKPQKRR